MQDFILREIDRIGEMLMQVDLKEVMQHEHPVEYLVEEMHFSEGALEAFTEIAFCSDIEEEAKKALLQDALDYLDGRGYFSFKLHSLQQ
jgi:hypothetical protein